MPLPFSKFVSVAAVIATPPFTVEKKHALLAMTSPLIPSTAPVIEFSGPAALTNFGHYFGTTIPEYTFARKYLNFLSKSGTSPDKLLVARWYKTAAAAFVMGTTPAPLSVIKAFTTADLTISINGQVATDTMDFSTANSYSDVAAIIQSSLQGNTSGGAAWTAATCVFNSQAGGFILTNGTTGATSLIDSISSNTSGLLNALGFTYATISTGADPETWTQFCDRILNANTAGFSITTCEILQDTDITSSVAWLQGMQGQQTIYTVCRLVFNLSDKLLAKSLQAQMKTLGYTGYVITYDKFGDLPHTLSCARAAATDYNTVNSAPNFNFTPAVGYTPITSYDTIGDYQAGNTNLSVTQDLDDSNISYIYSVGTGTQSQTLYGLGQMNGVFQTEDVQVNESWLEMDIKTAVMNGFISVEKFKLQGADAAAAIGALIDPSFQRGKANGTIANGGTLTDTNKLSISQATGNPRAVDAVASNGYYFQIQPLTQDDINKRQVRILVCYLAAGVVNFVRIINRIYQ